MVQITTVQNKGIEAIIISGDISWKCKPKGYEKAEEWVKKLLRDTSLSADKIIVCPGNHDVDQSKCVDMEYRSNKEDVAKSLNVERLDDLSVKFSRYIDWCKSIGTKKYWIGNRESYLIGSTQINDVEFWVLNTAWYALKGGAEDQNKLWIGDSFLDVLINDSNNNTQDKLRVALHHHPNDWINKNEILKYSTIHKCLYEKLSDCVSCVFTGHTHAIPGEPNKYVNSLYCFGAGATYASDKYLNSFSIYDVNVDGTSMGYTHYLVDKSSWVPKIYESISFSKKIEPQNTEVITLEPSISSSLNLKNILVDNGFNLIKVNTQEFSLNRTIIWPVVPRRNLTNIHLAQLELMELLYKKCGWKVRIIISNCGANPLSPEETKTFRAKVKDRCDILGIEDVDFDFLRDFFENKPEISNEILLCFIQVGSILRIPELATIKEKQYSADKRNETQISPVLDYILPVLQFAVIKQISEDIIKKENKKSIVIAGNDEKLQWGKAIEIIGDSNVGAILIPELNNREGENINQDTNVSVIRSIIQSTSMDDLKEALEIDSVAQWFYRMFVFLAHYENISKADIFTDSSGIPEHFWVEKTIPLQIDKKKLLECIWSRIERDN